VPELKLIVEDKRGRIDIFMTWLPRIGVAVAFLSIGYGKFGEHSSWVRIFDRIGFGQWFRYLTGTMQIAGAVLVLIPRTFVIGILMLACTMFGAMLVWIFIVRAPFNAFIPGTLLVILLAMGLQSLRNR
jgi:uncharacterized membrane protein